MRSSRQLSRNKTQAKTGQIWTAQHRTAIKQLLKSNTPARVTVSRLQKLLSAFRVRAKKLGALTKSSNGRNRH